MHQHHHDCNCGHDHDHHHGPDCNCGHEHIEILPVEDLSILQQNFLLALYEKRYLPVARFALQNAQNDDVYGIALEPVYLGSPNDTIDRVKEIGEALNALEQGGLLTLDYDIPLGNYPYDEYEQADLYRYFVETVGEGAQQPGALFDVAALEKGSMALTPEGEQRVLAMLPKP